MTLRIYLLGPVQINSDKKPLSLPGYRPLALLAYLLLSGKKQSREHLVNLLFDRPDDPRASLRWTLMKLRQSIGSGVLLADRNSIAFNFEADYWLDVDDFERGDLDLYRGQLLQGLDLRDAHQYDVWLLVERERLRAQYQAGLERRLEEQQEVGDIEAVENTAVQLLGLDNLREDWHRALISAYAQQGKFEAAQAQHELCCEILAQELGVDPSPEMVVLAQAIEQQQADLVRLIAARTPLSFPPPESREELTANQTAVPEHMPFERDPKWPINRKIVVGLSTMFFFLLVIALSLLTFQETEQSAAAKNNQGLAGTIVTLMGPFDEGAREVWQRSFAPFEEVTGIDVQFAGYPNDFEQVLPSVIGSGVTPDIVDFPQPGFLARFVRQGKVVDVRTFLDQAYLEQQYGQPLLEAAMMDNQMAGIWVATHVKSLVWYPKASFDEAGYEVPTTWDELMALSEQIMADGHTPWCISMESAEATGWVGTDWVEDILLRTAPIETYDAWVRGELPFDSPELRRVFTIMDAIWLNESFVYGGRENILAEDLFENGLHTFSDPPGCYLHRQGSFLVSFLPEDAVFGKDFDFFYLPPIDAEYGKPQLGGGDIMAMFNDRPEVREVMRFLTTADSVRLFVQSGGLIAPHRDAPYEWYSDPALLKISQILFEADAYRFDASDMMPAEVGTGSFWQGMVNWVEGQDLDTVLRQIDKSWPDQENP